MKSSIVFVLIKKFVSLNKRFSLKSVLKFVLQKSFNLDATMFEDMIDRLEKNSGKTFFWQDSNKDNKYKLNCCPVLYFTDCIENVWFKIFHNGYSSKFEKNVF